MKSLEQYLSAPLDIELSPDIDSPLVLERFKKLLSFESTLYFTKVSYVKKLVAALISEGKFKPFEFKVKRKFKPEAYMHDGGTAYISYGIFLHTSAAVFLSVLCHELSHIWLSQRDDYAELKKLDRAFREKYRDVLKSPVEVYARKAQTAMLKKIADALGGKKRERLLGCIEDENNKLNTLERGITALKAQL